MSTDLSLESICQSENVPSQRFAPSHGGNTNERKFKIKICSKRPQNISMCTVSTTESKGFAYELSESEVFSQ